jgi:hypothetical protein
MGALRQKSWVPVAVIVGVTYACVGILLALPTTNARMWRLTTWAVSAVVFATHIAFENSRPGNSHARAALHVALAAALGAFGLAVGANVHALQIGSSGRHRVLLMLSLVLWPLITGVPAFCVALAGSWILARLRRRHDEVPN